jgi:HEAT repeat protein
VRANAAHALGRLDPLPGEAIPDLIECAGDASAGLRLNAAAALQRAPVGTATQTMRHLVEDANPRIRLIAAGVLLAENAADEKAGAVLVEALSDPAARVRKAAVELIETLGANGVLFVNNLKEHEASEEHADIRELMGQLIEQFSRQVENAQEQLSTN